MYEHKTIFLKSVSQATLWAIDVNVTNKFGNSIVPWRHYRLTHTDGYMFIFPSTYPLLIEWQLPDKYETDVTYYDAGMYGLRPQDYATISHKFVMLPDHVSLSGNYEPTQHGDVPTADDTDLYVNQSVYVL